MKFGDLRGILQYVPQFRGRTFVVALDGAVVGSSAFSDICLDLAVLRSLNIRVVLVHGASAQVEKLAEKRNIVLSNSDGTGPVDDATMDVSLDAITRLASDIMQKLAALKIRAASANAVQAHPAGIRGGVDFGRTGEIERIDFEAIQTLLDQDILPVISPLGFHSKAGTLRVNSDELAMELAAAISADKLIFVVKNELAPVIKALGKRQLTTRAASEMIERDDHPEKWCFSKMSHAVEACENGVSRAHLISIEHPDALLAELFSNAGVGIMISDDSYQRFRPATEGDIDELMFILRRAIDSEKIVRRSRDELFAMMDDIILLEIDKNVVGCIAVHFSEAESVAEIACLYVKRTHEGMGYGRRLLTEALRKSREYGASRTIALSTQAVSFFESAGFSRSNDPSVMPAARREKWEASNRNSVLLVLENECEITNPQDTQT